MYRHDIKIFGYLWCKYCHELAKNLKEEKFKYEFCPMESAENRAFIKDMMKRNEVEEIKVPIVVFCDNSFTMRPSVEIIKKMIDTMPSC